MTAPDVQRPAALGEPQQDDARQDGEEESAQVGFNILESAETVCSESYKAPSSERNQACHRGLMRIP